MLVEEEFNSSNIQDGSNHKFNFDDINPTKNTRYRIELTKASGESVLSVGTYNESEYYKAYNNGSVYVNDEETSDTFIFRIDYRCERTYMSIISYLILSVLILGIEWISLSEYIISKNKTKVLRKKS